MRRPLARQPVRVNRVDRAQPSGRRELTGEELTAISQEMKPYRGFLK
jgi:hypothetical protein